MKKLLMTLMVAACVAGSGFSVGMVDVHEQANPSDNIEP
ncbi:hypothetical protein SAMN04488123_102396 [Natribacillus halophilus]|uniref:PapR protein n=1 Tax=Natribacillus halophilus TaxID=549003 RepID=A0A1G8KZG2_9BACI|nr:hypothetical protein SAMN04488123_102396 [Natribacillus halophilus]